MVYASFMRLVKVIDSTRGLTVADKVRVSETPSERRSGLLGTESLSENEGMLIVPCRQVHTLGMRYPIDVVFLDADYRVIRVTVELKPWRLSPFVRRAKAVLELRAGRVKKAGLAEGDRLKIVPAGAKIGQL